MLVEPSADIAGERAFLLGLVSLTEHDNLDALLAAALELLVARTQAREVYIEVIGGEEIVETSHVATQGCGEERIAQIRSVVSRGIIAAAISGGTTVVTSNATEDPRFSNLESVRQLKVEAVLCVPIGREEPSGVVYLQGREGHDDRPAFTERTRHDVELFARLLGPLVEHLLHRDGILERREPRATPGEDDPFRDVVGRGAALREVVEKLRFAAPLDIHVLLTGASGTGKTLLAKGIHLASKRRSAPFVEVNCAALPEALIENELFGAEPGAHSAVGRTGVRGKVESAEGGTLFLDEIGELPFSSQAKLLQLLQSRTYSKLGGSSMRHADVRIISATNVNLKAAVTEKKFREDLYFRLKVLEVRVPSLAERSEDLVPLSVYFLNQAVRRHDLSRKSLAPSAIRAVQFTPWPGNVRELANRIESAVVHAHLRGSDRVERRDLFPDEVAVAEQPLTLQAATRAFQRAHLSSVLQSSDWDIPETTRTLDISRSHLYGLMRALDLKRP